MRVRGFPAAGMRDFQVYLLFSPQRHWRHISAPAISQEKFYRLSRNPALYGLRVCKLLAVSVKSALDAVEVLIAFSVHSCDRTGHLQVPSKGLHRVMFGAPLELRMELLSSVSKSPAHEQHIQVLRLAPTVLAGLTSCAGKTDRTQTLLPLHICMKFVINKT